MILVDHVMAQLLVGSWLALSAILCVNLFIALLSDTFARVYDNAQANAVMQKAITILNIMEGLSSKRRKQFHSFLITECNPESLYYDDDTSYGGEDDLKKATIEVREMVSELSDKFESVFGHELDDDMNGLESLQAKLSGRTTKRAMPAPAQMMKNMNIVSVETFEMEIESLRDRIQEIRVEQNELSETVRNEMAGMKSILQDIAVVITGQVKPVESVYDTPGDEDQSKKKKKRRSRRAESSEGATSGRSLLVAPATAPMQIETYSATGTFLPSVTFPGHPRNDEEDA